MFRYKYTSNISYGLRYKTRHQRRDPIHFGFRYSLQDFVCSATWIEAATAKGNIDNLDCIFIIFNDIKNVLTTFKPYVLYICTVVPFIFVKNKTATKRRPHK